VISLGLEEVERGGGGEIAVESANMFYSAPFIQGGETGEEGIPTAALFLTCVGGERKEGRRGNCLSGWDEGI